MNNLEPDIGVKATWLHSEIFLKPQEKLASVLEGEYQHEHARDRHLPGELADCAWFDWLSKIYPEVPWCQKRCRCAAFGSKTSPIQTWVCCLQVTRCPRPAGLGFLLHTLFFLACYSLISYLECIFLDFLLSVKCHAGLLIWALHPHPHSSFEGCKVPHTCLRHSPFSCQ